jgi:hypothetical protein
MKIPPYIRGLIDLFSTGKRVAITLGILGVSIVLISLAIETSSHLNSDFYNGPTVTGNLWTYIGVFIILLAFLAFIGDIRYSAIQQREQEVEGRQRLRSAEDKLANPLGNATPVDKETGESAILGRPNTDDRLALSVLWELTNARLDQYHQIATGQARRSFATAQSAIAVGFLLLIGFAVLSFRTHSTTASITTAALGAVAAALTGYISRTFIRSQETSARHLHAYFNQPLEFSRYLAAERLLSSQPDATPKESDALLRIIIGAMVEQTEPDNAWEAEFPESISLRSLRNLLETKDQSSQPSNELSKLPCQRRPGRLLRCL